MITVDDASGIAIALARGRPYRVSPCEGGAHPPCWSARRHSGRAVFLVSVGLNTGPALITFISLAEICGR
jgi:hypothetical protein